MSERPKERPWPCGDFALERRDDALYLVEPSGERWRVHDCRFARGRPRRMPLGAAAANTRYFVNASGERRAYTFTKGDRRDLSLETVVQHLRGAGYVGRETFDATSRTPGAAPSTTGKKRDRG